MENQTPQYQQYPPQQVMQGQPVPYQQYVPDQQYIPNQPINMPPPQHIQQPYQQQQMLPPQYQNVQYIPYYPPQQYVYHPVGYAPPDMQQQQIQQQPVYYPPQPHHIPQQQFPPSQYPPQPKIEDNNKPQQILGQNVQYQQKQQSQQSPSNSQQIQSDNTNKRSINQMYENEQRDDDCNSQITKKIQTNSNNNSQNADKVNINSWLQSYIENQNLCKMLIDYKEGQTSEEILQNNFDFLKLKSNVESLLLKKPKRRRQNHSLIQKKQQMQKLLDENKKVSQGIEQQQNAEKIQQQFNITSKFHNKNKLLLNQIMKFLDYRNLQYIQMTSNMRNEIADFIEKVKATGRKMGKNNTMKTDLYNHSHYNLMFLKLNPRTLKYIKENQKDKSLHDEVFELDFSNDDIIKSPKILEINFIKKVIFEIISRHLKQDWVKSLDAEEKNNEESDEGNNSDEDKNYEKEYKLKAFLGIEQMQKGFVIQRF